MKKKRRYAIVDGRRVLIKPWRGVDGYEVKWTDSCSGCFECEDGHPVGDYPRHPKHGCYIGAGCEECGYHGVTVRRHWVALDAAEAERKGVPICA
jgi:hypothetical protein